MRGTSGPTGLAPGQAWLGRMHQASGTPFHYVEKVSVHVWTDDTPPPSRFKSKQEVLNSFPPLQNTTDGMRLPAHSVIHCAHRVRKLTW